MVSLPAGITEVEPLRVLVCSQVLEMVAPVQEKIEAVDLSVLSQGEQGEVMALLKQCQYVFSAHDGDLGFTDVISHEIPLLDSVSSQVTFIYIALLTIQNCNKALHKIKIGKLCQ